jgi:predicted nucleotidyltransferase
MRLEPFEVLLIKQVFRRFSTDPELVLYLFGSRADDKKRGGDIDLLVVGPTQQTVNSFPRLDFLVELKRSIGDRRIDITMATSEELESNSFLKSGTSNKIQIS